MVASTSTSTRFNVFLSFCGEDTRDSFTDHLYAGLNRAGIRTFRDNDEIRRGHDLEPEIIKAIKDSKASVVVLSENYPKSRWCLDELLLILEQRQKCNHFVLPVFYHVDPSDVRYQRQSFAIEEKEGVEGSKWTVVNVNRWKSALTEVANLTGIVASGSEIELIAKIVNAIDYELDLKLISTPAHLTGMETRAKDINSWLKNEDSNTDVLAICGMGGSGKTTLAQYIYNSNKQNFECSSYLEEIGKHYKQPYGLLGLQNRLLTDILGGKDVRVSCVSEGTSKIEEALHKKRVLIVLDDIDEHDELGALLGTNVIHTQSKIIITTRLLDIHAWFGSVSWRCHVHKLKLLNDHESLELLSCHAFGSKIPMEGFSDLAVKLAQYCGGNPLALKVLGSSLFVSAKDPRERNSIIEVWRSRLNSLSSLKGDLDSKIQGILQRSFDSLQLRSRKELFLHIAIFFVGEDEDYVVKILEHDWHAKAGIMTLISRCLLTVSPNKKLMMHQLLQDMGRNIVHDEAKDPAKHTRVWCSDEAYCMLTKGDGSKTIQGLALDMRKLKKGTKALVLKTGSLAKMHKLKLLQLKFVKLTGSFKNFPELRWLSWHGCHFKTMPSSLLLSSLVALDMSFGNLEKFKPPMVLNSLKILNLEACEKLISVHNLHRLPNLETLILWDCKNLIHICQTIGGLESLSLLNLAGCSKLWKVLSHQKYMNPQQRLKALCSGRGIPQQTLFSLPCSLKFLFLDYCKLEDDNDIHVVFNVQSLYGLSLAGNLFEFLPSHIDLKMLRVLNLSSCKNIKSILYLPNTLEELYTYWCKSLEKITFESARFRLQKFGYKGCIKLSVVQGLFKLVSVAEVDEADLGHMQWIKTYQDHTLDLVGDEITKGRIWRIQMLYEYGIMSTYLAGIEDQSMMIYDYTSSYDFLSFCVPLDPNKRRIQGLYVTFLYRSSGCKDKDKWVFFAEISNTSKGLTWIYNPLVYCKPRVNEDVAWLSYWPIRNILDAGDEVMVSIVVEKGLTVSWCGASLVYTGDRELHQEDNTLKGEEVIGGDLSEFEVTTGVYYLCRRDFFRSSGPDVVKKWFPHTINNYTEWRKSNQSQHLDASCMHLNLTLPKEQNSDTLYKDFWLGYFNSESEICKIKKVVSRLEGVDFVDYDTNRKTLYVSGAVDCMAMETCVREFQKTVTVIGVRYRTELLLKHRDKKIVIWKGDKNHFYEYSFGYMFSTRRTFF